MGDYEKGHPGCCLGKLVGERGIWMTTMELDPCVPTDVSAIVIHTTGMIYTYVYYLSSDGFVLLIRSTSLHLYRSAILPIQQHNHVIHFHSSPGCRAYPCNIHPPCKRPRRWLLVVDFSRTQLQASRRHEVLHPPYQKRDITIIQISTGS